MATMNRLRYGSETCHEIFLTLVDQIGPGSARREPFTHPFIINVPFNYNGKFQL